MTLRLHRGWPAFLRVAWAQWRSPRKRGNCFPLPPLRVRLTMACRMGGAARAIALGPPYRPAGWIRWQR